MTTFETEPEIDGCPSNLDRSLWTRFTCQKKRLEIDCQSCGVLALPNSIYLEPRNTVNTAGHAV